MAPLLCRLHARVQPARDKRARLQLSDALLVLGEQLMAQAEAMVQLCLRTRARLYRDGLMIAFLGCHPERSQNFTSFEVGRHLLRGPEGWWLEIEAAEMKTNRPVSKPLQARIVPALILPDGQGPPPRRSSPVDALAGIAGPPLAESVEIPLLHARPPLRAARRALFRPQ